MKIERPYARPVSAILALGLLAFALACRLTTTPRLAFDRRHESLLDAILGEARTSISAQCFEMADLYFHRGVGHQRARAFDTPLYERWHAIVSPQGHLHLHGTTEIREIMPWLRFALRADPHNVEAYLVAAFWLAYEGGHANVARDVLLEGQRNNPYCARIQLALGRLDVHTGRFDLALQAFDAALAFWDAQLDHDSEDARLDRVQGLLYRALLREEAGKTTEAIRDLTELVSLVPDPGALAKRRDQLLQGHTPEVSARDLLTRTARQNAKDRHNCERENDGNDAHDEHRLAPTRG